MTEKIKELTFTLLLGICLSLSACGQENTELSSDDLSSSPAPLQWEDVYNLVDETVDLDKLSEFMGIKVPEQDSKEETPENVVLLGARSWDYQSIYKLINAFNKAQDEYKVEVKKYSDVDSMFLDLVRGQGCDLLLLTPSYLTILSDKGGLEDLTPYFEKSEKVSLENLFNVALEIGTAGGKLAGVIPDFSVQAILVEKGYTKDGGWTIEEYLALMDKYQDVPLSHHADPKNVNTWLMNELSALPEAFVNWENRTCDFENEAFIQTIETLKNYLERCQSTDVDSIMPNQRADIMYKRQFQTMQITFDYGQYFSGYKSLRDAFLESYELAGFPNQDGGVRYPMGELIGATVVFGMNTASVKKDAAWLFLEYMLSDYQETIVEKGDSLNFPVRRDIVERELQAEIEADPEDFDITFYQNAYTGEKVRKRGEFTEEDKEQVLYVLDHASAPTILQAGSTFRTIVWDELGAFLAGDKTAAEAAHLIQNRVSLYLSE